MYSRWKPWLGLPAEYVYYCHLVVKYQNSLAQNIPPVFLSAYLLFFRFVD